MAPHVTTPGMFYDQKIDFGSVSPDSDAMTSCPSITSDLALGSAESIEFDPFDYLNIPFDSLPVDDSWTRSTSMQLQDPAFTNTSTTNFDARPRQKSDSPARSALPETERKERRREQNRRAQQMYRQRQESLVSGLRTQCAVLRRENEQLKNVLKRTDSWPGTSTPSQCLHQTGFSFETEPPMDFNAMDNGRRGSDQCWSCLGSRARTDARLLPMMTDFGNMSGELGQFGTVKQV